MPRSNGGSTFKRKNSSTPDPSPPQKRAKLLMDDEDSASNSSTSGQVRDLSISKSSEPSTNNGFTVNHEFARRFEHNKKREELHKCMVT